MFLGIIAKFFGKGCIQNELRTQTPTKVTSRNMDATCCDSRKKDKKYLAFLRALTFHEDYDTGKNKK